jgi:hypothetical protein
MTDQLEAQPAQPDQQLVAITKPIRLRSILESIMHLPRTDRRSTLKNVTRNLLKNLQKAKRAFKLVWNLYTLSRQLPLSTTPKGTGDSGSAASALDAIQWEFISHPFAISRPAHSHSHTPFSILNQDHDIAARKENLAKKLGKDWIDDYFTRRNPSSSQLVEAQITLFELVWSGTIQNLKVNPPHNADDPEYEGFQETLDQLDKSLQEVIARSQRPRFTISFYGMVKAGKSLFLNAMIGKLVLPSDGKYACDSDGQEYLCRTVRTTLDSVAMPIGPCEGTGPARASGQDSVLQSRHCDPQKTWLRF